MPHIYFLIEFSLLYIIRDICVYSSMIRFISSYLYTHTRRTDSSLLAISCTAGESIYCFENKTISTSIKLFFWYFFPLLFCWRTCCSSTFFHWTFRTLRAECISPLQSSLWLSHTSICCGDLQMRRFRYQQGYHLLHQCWWWWLIVNWFRCAHHNQITNSYFVQTKIKKLHGEFIQ